MQRVLASIIFLSFINIAWAQISQRIGAKDFSDWQGMAKVTENTATLEGGGTLSYTYSNQNRIYFPGISRPFNGDAADWTRFSGLAFEIYLQSEDVTEVTIILKVDEHDYNELNPISSAKIVLPGNRWHTVYLPWDRFDVALGQRCGTLFAIKQLLLFAASDKKWQLRNVRVTKGLTTSIEANIKGKASDAGTKVTYDFEVGNTTAYPQGVQLLLQKQGWETMSADLSESAFELAPGEVRRLQLEVAIPETLPVGIREKQVIRAMANGFGESEKKIEFTTAVRVPTPNIVFTNEGWQKVREKVEKYPWARQGYEDYVKKAEKWKVPRANDFSEVPGRPLGKTVFNTTGREVYDCGVAYQLTKNETYATKCLQFLRQLSAPETGYPATLVGGSNSFVGEGKFWQAVGRMYDMVRESEQFTEADHRQIQETFRLFATQTIKGNSKGAISNWNVAELTAAFYCAMNLQDWNLIEQILSGPTGIYRHLEHGIMNDGWWYECAVGYNTWVASEFSEIAIALQPWGVNFKDMQFPLGTSKHFSLLASRRQGGIMGMEFEKWGGMQRNYVCIKDMWDAAIPFIDFRGVLPAINDAVEDKVSGKSYELAYHLYRDPEYAAIIKRGEERDLLYGVPDLPDYTSDKMKQSAYADNMGVVMLRSQTKSRAQSEQIQAALHYGSHGGYHGHFDRTSLVNMTRYGRSFYGTLAYWFGYSSYMYKFWKQTSINKNMVVVDEKMQMPVENFRTLFHSGDMMQAAAIETNSKWAYAPYGGIPRNNSTFAQQMWSESRTIEMPEDAPDFGVVSGYTEPVMQRRILLVMDDYLVLADYLEGKEEHQFDWMLQIKGFKDITAEKLNYSHHTNQMNTDPLGSAQFITDCNWYKAEGTSKTQYEMCWGEGCDNKGLRLPHAIEGALKMDVYNAWPLKKEIMIGTSTQTIYVNKKLWYTVVVDGETLLNDSTGAWILGSKNVELDISGKKKLELISKTEKKVKNKTLFWGDAKLLLKDGSELFIASLPVKYENVLLPKEKGTDYYGGPIKIQGELMSNSTPAMPEALTKAAKVTVDLSGLDAVAFKAKVGGDYPLGNEAARLKNMAVRSHGKKTRYLSVIEPYETRPIVKSVKAKNENHLVVELNDGRVQEITISGLEGDGKKIKVSAKEFVNGKFIREEETD